MHIIKCIICIQYVNNIKTYITDHTINLQRREAWQPGVHLELKSRPEPSQGPPPPCTPPLPQMISF